MNSDILIINAKVYTVDDKCSIKRAVAIKNKKIIYVGDSINLDQYIGRDTKVIDAKKNLVLPGFIDSHTHPPGTSLTEIFEVSLYGLNSIEEYKEAIIKFINKNKNLDVVYGRGWSLGVFENEELIKGPKKEHLDEICNDKPIILRAYDGHTIWMNSKAFERFSINVDTQCPVGGKIEINEDSNEIWGTLKESATHLIKEHDYNSEHYKRAFEDFQNKMHKYGITSMLSISGLNWGISPLVYEELEKENKLKMRVTNSIMISPDDELKTQIDKIIKIRDRYDSNYFKTSTVKFLGDGVVEGSTANLIEPYELIGENKTCSVGEFLWQSEKFTEAIKISNENGFSIHVHSVGDGSTNKTLNAIEESQKILGNNDYRNTITHLQLVKEDDISRFRCLNIIANVQPYWHIKGPGWWDVVDYKLLGDRARYEYPLRSFFKENVLVCSSSDHSVTPTPNPLYGIEAGVTRNLYNASYFGVDDIEDMDDERWILNKEERVSVEEMIKSFTINGAYSIFRENEVGSIEVGKYADIIILDKDIFNINPIDIEKAKVIMTIFDGEIVYDKISS